MREAHLQVMREAIALNRTVDLPLRSSHKVRPRRLDKRQVRGVEVDLIRVEDEDAGRVAHDAAARGLVHRPGDTPCRSIHNPTALARKPTRRILQRTADGFDRTSGAHGCENLLDHSALALALCDGARVLHLGPAGEDDVLRQARVERCI